MASSRTSKVRTHVRSNIVGYIALMVALVGVPSTWAVARNTVGSAQIKKNAVKNPDLADNAVRSPEVADGALLSQDFAPGQLPVGTQGPPGPPGQPGENTGAPAGAVSFFNLEACPSGWTELTAARGRNIVGLPVGGTLAGTAGTALNNLENRAVGQHNHGVTDPGHTHNVPVPLGTDDAGNSGFDLATQNTSSNFDTDPSFAGITVTNAGAVSGTNAPYIQLLVCQKS